MSKDAFYFPHDSNAKEDPKCVLLIEQLGPEGYGIYWILIETLRDQPGYRYPMVLISALARKYNTTAEKVKAVIVNYNLFTTDDKDFFSESLIKRMASYEHKREMAVKAGKISAAHRLLNASSTSVEQTLNGGLTSVEQQFNMKEEIRREEIKLKEIRREESNDLSTVDYSKVFTIYEQNIGQLTPVISEKIKGSFTEYPGEWIVKAIEKATILEKRNWGYVEGILKGWKRDGFKNNGNGGNGHGGIFRQMVAGNEKPTGIKIIE